MIMSTLALDARSYKKFADVRFDSNRGSTIYYHDDLASFTASVKQHPANHVLGWQDTTTPSDIFKVLQEFLSTTASSGSICGSRLFILMVRDPNTGDEQLIDFDNLRYNSVSAYIVKTNYFGNIGPGPVDALASGTNGLVAYAMDVLKDGSSEFTEAASLFMDAPYFDNLWFTSSWNPILNQTYTLKYYPAPDNTTPLINATLAITTSLSSKSADFNDFFNIDITLKEYYSGKSTQLHYDRSDLIGESDLIWKSIELTAGESYEITMAHWSTREEMVEIRIYI